MLYFVFYQIIVNKKCQKFDYGEAGNKKHYNQVDGVKNALT